LSLSPPGQGAIQVLSIRFTLTASAVAGGRTPVLLADDGTSVFWQSASGDQQEPSTTAAYCAYPGAPIAGGDVAAPTEASATGAAAAAGSAALPAGATITGWEAIFQAPAAAVAGQITVTNVQGGTLTYDVQQELNLPTTIGDQYPGNGLPASSGGVGPTVNIPAMVSGGAWSLEVRGTINVGSPRSVPLPREGLHLRRGMRLRTVTAGLDVGDQYAAVVAYVQEFPDAPGEQFDPTMPTEVSTLDG
jgi:hypothetical protein